MDCIPHKELSDVLLGIAFTVHSGLGPGLLEQAYEAAFSVELSRARIPYERQKRFPLHYRGVLIGEYVADLVVADAVLLELKAVERLSESMQAQLINYLKISGIEVGYLINFRNSRVEWKRFLNARDPP